MSDARQWSSPYAGQTGIMWDDDTRYAVIRGRDARYDGQFITAVLSTGIYCRPS